MNGKGDKRRPEDAQAYRNNFDRTFGPSVDDIKRARDMIDAQPVPTKGRMVWPPLIRND